jgi:hypothetical protein
MGISSRQVIEQIISSKYNEEDMQDRKRRLVNLFFTDVLTNQEYQNTLELINDTSTSMRKELDFANKFGNLGIKANRMEMLYNITHEQREKYTEFNENIRKHFDFRIGSEESKLHFRMGPQSSYFYIILDHRLENSDQYRSHLTYNSNKRVVRSQYGMGKEIKYKPQVYINPKKTLFKNVLNFMKEKNWFDDFQFQFEEKVLLVI